METQTNFRILKLNNFEFSVKNLNTNKTQLFDIKKPYDENEIAFNINQGCNIKNCEFPNVCLNQSTCLCDSSYANILPTKIKNKNLNNENNENKEVTEKQNIISINKYCSYKRADPKFISLAEIFLPGIGYFLLGYHLYGMFKFVSSCILLSLVILKLGRFLSKDKLPEDVKNFEFVEYEKDFYFYVMMAAYAVIVIWMMIDLFLIENGKVKDPNGINFVIFF